MNSVLAKYTPKETIHFLQDFDVSVQTLFNFFSVHENWGKIFPAAVKRIEFGEDPRDANSKGSVRRVIAFPIILEEKITQYVQDQLIEYKIISGIGIKDHLGTMVFIDLGNGKSRLDYKIEFAPSLPMTGFILKNVLEKVVGEGVREAARKLRLDPRF
ncbi:MAG TPA: SRPBCC family protein [Chitinophagales bacterium]|nr:SRPBCC family protein [Chitinophagales bacterium]